MKTISSAIVLAAMAMATSASADSLNVAYSVQATAVPTMAEWAMITMAVALAAGALYAIQRRRMAALAVACATVVTWGGWGCKVRAKQPH